MDINNPKNELYQDFVQLVTQTSSAVTDITVKPLSGQIKIVTDDMRNTCQVLKNMSNEISQQTTNTVLEIKKASQDVSSLAQAINNNGNKLSVLNNIVEKSNNNIINVINNTNNNVELMSKNILNRINGINDNIIITLETNSKQTQHRLDKIDDKNQDLESQILILSKKQQEFFYWIIGVNVFFGLSILLYLFFGVK